MDAFPDLMRSIIETSAATIATAMAVQAPVDELKSETETRGRALKDARRSGRQMARSAKKYRFAAQLADAFEVDHPGAFEKSRVIAYINAHAKEFEDIYFTAYMDAWTKARLPAGHQSANDEALRALKEALAGPWDCFFGTWLSHPDVVAVIIMVDDPNLLDLLVTAYQETAQPDHRTNDFMVHNFNIRGGFPEEAGGEIIWSLSVPLAVLPELTAAAQSPFYRPDPD